MSSLPSSLTAQLAAGGGGQPSAVQEGRREEDPAFEAALFEVEREFLSAHGATAAAGIPVQQPPVVLGRPVAGGVDSVEGGPTRFRVQGKDAAAGQPGGAQEIAVNVLEALDERYAPLVDRLRGRVKDYAGRVDWAQKAHERWELDKRELEDKMEDLRAETASLRERVASMAASGASASRRAPISISGGRGGARAQRDGLDMGAGFDIDLGGSDTGALGKLELDTGRGRAAKLRRQAKLLFRRLTPLRRDIRFVQSRYGRTCGSFFVFQRFLLFMSIMVLLAYSPLLVAHGIDVFTQDSWVMCSTPLFPVPCLFIYGGFNRLQGTQRDPWLAVKYMGAIVGSAGLLLYLSVARWMFWNNRVQAESLEEDLHPKRWSSLVLQAWDFRMATAEDRQNWGQGFATRLRAIHGEEEQSRKRNGLTRCQRYCLFLRRAFGMLLNVLLIAGAWLAVTLSTIHRQDISNGLSKYLGEIGMGDLGTQIGDLAPNLVVSSIGGLLPVLTKQITNIEAWAPATRARHNLWRLYLGKILNLVIVVMLHVELMLGAPLYRGDQVLSERDSKTYACVEDQAAAELISLVVTEFILGLALRPISGLVSAWVYHRILDRRSSFQKPEFEIPDSAVDLIYFQCLLWITTLLAPPLVLVTPVVLCFQFKWLKFSLVHLTSRPFVSETSALSVTFLQLLGFSCLVFGGLAYGLATASCFPHSAQCGPFESYKAPVSVLVDLDVPGVSSAGQVVAFLHANAGIAIGFVSLLALVIVLHGRSGLNAHRMAIEQLQASAGRNVEALQGEVQRLERHGDLLKRRLEWHEKSKL